MKHPNHFGRWLACVLLCLLLAGCSMPGEQVQVEELLRAPKLSGDYGDVQTALNDWLGESAQLKYPMQGDLLSPFLLQDLDGDGRQDAAVLYTTAQSSNVCIAILQKDDADIWHVRQNVEGLADTVESVGLAQLQPGDATQLVVGYTAAQGDHYLAVYSYTDGVLSTILEQQYQQYLVEDITGGGNQDLILMSTLEDSGASRHCAYLVVDQVNPGLTDLFTRQFRKVAQEQQKSSVLQKLKQEPPARKPAAPKKRELER